MNEYDTNRIYDTVKNIGYFKTNDHLNADCYLLNTCHIRDKSKEKVFDEIGRVRKNYNAHDENNKFKTGDKVSIIESKPFSKNKKFQVMENTK